MIGNRFFRPALIFLCMLGLLLASGCITEFQKIKNWEYFPWNQKPEVSVRQEEPQEKAVEKEENEPEFLVHRIRWKGETLSIIAKWYMGRIDDWKKLAEINPGLDPQNLQKGEEVRIPEKKLKTYVPMPRDFLGAFAGNPENSEKEKPVEDENISVETGKDDKAGKELQIETVDKQKFDAKGEKKASDQTGGNESSDDTVDIEPDLFGPKDLNTE